MEYNVSRNGEGQLLRVAPEKPAVVSGKSFTLVTKLLRFLPACQQQKQFSREPSATQ